MAYSDAKSFDYNQHVVVIDGKDYIDGHRIKTGNEFVTSILLFCSSYGRYWNVIIIRWR